MVLNDSQIKRLVDSGEMVIEPFHSGQVRGDGPSFGLSSFGYDFQLDSSSLLFPNRERIAPGGDWFESSADDVIHLPPGEFMLAQTVEWIKVPADVIGVSVGKSTVARLGVQVTVTPLEPGWEGRLTLEITNPTRYEVTLPVGGITQVVFFRGSPPVVNYASRKGVYMGQEVPTPAKFK